MPSNDEYVNNLRVSLLDQEWIRRIFTYLRDYYGGKSYDLLPILNLLEASLLNTNSQARNIHEIIQGYV